MVINFAKTKEIVFRRPCPVRFDRPPAFSDIEQVSSIKFLGVILQSNFCLDIRIDFNLEAMKSELFELFRVVQSCICCGSCAVKVYLLNKINVVFNAL